MATLNFKVRPRPSNTNEPLTYDIIEVVGKEQRPAGTLVKQKNKWRLSWAGVQAAFASKHELLTHFRALGHSANGLA